MPSLPAIEKDVQKRAEKRRPKGAFDEPEAEEANADPLEDAYYDYLLRLGDDALILGQRLSEWCGHAPSVEVDLSLANVALDLIGQATHILGQANNGDGDELAFKRDVLDFRNCLLVEQPNGDFARTIVRQLLYSTWQHMLFLQLAESPDPFLRAIAASQRKEEWQGPPPARSAAGIRIASSPACRATSGMYSQSLPRRRCDHAVR